MPETQYEPDGQLEVESAQLGPLGWQKPLWKTIKAIVTMQNNILLLIVFFKSL